MACYHPLKGFVVGKTENGKKDLKIVPYDTECLFKPLGSDFWERHGYLLDPKIHHGRIVTDFVTVPCGQCIGCRLEYSRQWAIRCMLEAEDYESNYFITFTYDDDHLPTGEYINDDGVICESHSLCKKHMQKFCKDLRSALSYRNKPSFRFYLSGEYGDKKGRPHYHMIAFGLELDDLEFYEKTDIGCLYTSKFLNEVWDRGRVIVGDVTFESCAYVARYIMKKQKGETDFYDCFNIIPPFTNMSRRPGVGNNYFQSNISEMYPNDKLVLSGGRVVRPPVYFDRLYDEIDHEGMEFVKEQRKEVAEALQEHKQQYTTALYQEQLLQAERNKAAQIKKLVRPLD